MPDLTQEHSELLDMVRAGLDPADYAVVTFTPGDAAPVAMDGASARAAQAERIQAVALVAEAAPSLDVVIAESEAILAPALTPEAV
ncbi:MAG: hypothetical protein KJ728_11940 [Alphaproteobacteria bacterium]|uniref:Uncharacterized protein n=1 Tax=viral metagenome TaxID=1070528 RepID=A0A6M3XC71_9ZZZZ|nr:hypothetical protein [Alphaproteobacteria bacterium]